MVRIRARVMLEQEYVIIRVSIRVTSPWLRCAVR